MKRKWKLQIELSLIYKMDVKQLIFEVIPNLEKLFFPRVLLGEEISFTQDEYGYWARSNKDIGPEDWDYIPNTIINIIPSENLNKVKSYFDLSYFTSKQLEYIFTRLDKSLKHFDLIPMNKFLSYDSLEIKFELVEKDLTYKKNELISNYNIFKESIFITQIKNDNSIITTDLKIRNTAPSKNSFKIIAGASKKNKATSLFEALEKGNHVNITSKNDFINAFIGNAPANKINWTGMFGDLKSFINYSISENLIEKVNMKWVVTSNIFTHNYIHFNNDKIKDTETTTGDNNIKKIVQSIF